MVEDSIATFETFCHYQDPAIISAEQGLASKYREVIRTYASFADPISQVYSSAKLSPPVAIRWRNAGLRAIKGVVSSESLAADGRASLNIILPVILENLYSPNEDVLVPLKAKLRETDHENDDREAARARRVSVATVDTVDGDPALAAQSTADADRQAEMNARLLALRCLEQIIVSGSNRGQIRIAATVILRFIASKRFPRTATRDQSSGMNQQDGNWATSLIELIATWCPVQVRFVILMTAMDILHNTTPKEDALESSFTVLSVVDWLLKSPVNMIGLSVMDILLGLMHYISDLLSPTDGTAGDAEKNVDLNGDSAVFISPRRKALLSLLEQCIGNLATHNYYGDQVADMMRAILRQFKPTSNYENAVQSSLATVHETRAVSMAPPNTESEQTNGEKAHGETFSHAAAKLTALRAVKAILVVANIRAPASIKSSESRNQVGIHVWEGTQGLLRDSDLEVRHAYADAFLSWLQLETNKHDLKVRLDTPKYVKPASKRDSEALDKTSSRRSTSAPGNQREKSVLAAQSNFLRLLHLDIYDAALSSPAVGSEVLVLHLLLASLVENLGVNAAQFGLPMVLKLQDDLFTSVDLGSFAARVNIGSLVHGYLLALAEKFNLESTHAGVEVRNEIQKRQSKGQWFSKIKLPPTTLDGIAMDEKVMDDDHNQSITLTPFRNVEGLVSGIDEAYRQLISSPPQSPPTSPAGGFTFPVLNHAQAPQQSHQESGLPSSVKEQMLSSWSRESCLAAIERESIRTASISGSRGGTMTRNSHINGITNGSPVGSAMDRNRPTSVPDISYTPEPSSGRGSPVRVTELRRVLSVNTESNLRRRSPLRGQVDASNISVMSSGSDSMVSGAYSASDMEPDAASNLQEGQQTPEDGGSETPRAVALSGDQGQESSLSRTNSQEIPPVPPIPVGLAIPGGFPNDSQRSLISIDRPATAPDNSRQMTKPSSKSESSHNLRNGTLNRNKSRSSNHLASSFSDGFYAESNGSDSPLDTAQRDQLRKLLDGFLSPEDSPLTNGDRPSTAVPTSKSSLAESYSSRRQVSGGGLGRPPY